MPKVIDVPGYGPTEFPDEMDDAAIVAAIQKNMVKPGIGADIQAAQQAQSQQQMTHAKPPNTSAATGFLRGMKDPIDAGAQMLTHALPKGMVNAGNVANNWIAETTGLVGEIPAGGFDAMLSQEEAKYQQGRRDSGRKGFDAARMGGNVTSLIAPTRAIPMAATLAGRAGINAGVGGAVGAMQPIYSGDFAEQKADQIKTGMATGLLATPASEFLARLIMPRAATNPDVTMLRQEGIRPTVGQTLGGMASRIEEKAQSLPLLGDAITAARARANHEFNRAAINRTVRPIGGRVDDAGSDAVKRAGDMLSDSYEQGLRGLQGVTLDTRAVQELNNLRQMARNLPAPTQKQFNNILNNFTIGRMTPNQGMAAGTFKLIDSDLGKRAASYRSSSTASERELGDAILEAQRIIQDAASRQNPTYARALQQSREGWANLVRVEQAAKMAVGDEGVFRPSQLLSAIRGSDQSVRKRAVARGDALMQDLGGAGQRVLAGRTPNSGTVDRAMLLGTGGAAVADPLLTGGLLLGGAAGYSRPVQNALTYAITQRPQSANALANFVRQAAPLSAASQ